MGNDSYPVLLTGTASTTLGSVMLYDVCVNKVLTGTMILKETATALANFDIGTPRGNYHTVPNGARYANLVVTLSAGDDVTVYVRKVN